ncbi:MAG: hypothetical protein OK456_01615 [Thaumarchaeota archaeon]|nr:hypothetical protein [Nitrososphaerota archaeon]
MPRGLGEDPLSRKRRTRSSRTGSAASSPLPGSAVPDGAAPGSVLPTAQTPFQGSAASSYNEVFFHRRESQGEAQPTPSAPADTVGDAESFAPQEQTIVTSAVDLQQTAPSELGSVSPSEATVEVSTPILPIEAPPLAVEPELVQANATQQLSAQPAPEKRGFLSRFFGKLRK